MGMINIQIISRNCIIFVALAAVLASSAVGFSSKPASSQQASSVAGSGTNPAKSSLSAANDRSASGNLRPEASEGSGALVSARNLFATGSTQHPNDYQPHSSNHNVAPPKSALEVFTAAKNDASLPSSRVNLQPAKIPGVTSARSDLKSAPSYHYPAHGHNHHGYGGHDAGYHGGYGHGGHHGLHGGGYGIGHHGLGGHYGDKYFHHASVPYPDAYDYGYRRGNPYHTIERYEHRKGPHSLTKVKWADKHGGYGEQVWDYNHGDHHGHLYGNHYSKHYENNEPSYHHGAHYGPHYSHGGHYGAGGHHDDDYTGGHHGGYYGHH